MGTDCPRRGVGAALMLPFANTQAMQLHLDEISNYVAHNAHAVFLKDRASWHYRQAGRTEEPRHHSTALLAKSPSISAPLNPNSSRIWRLCSPTIGAGRSIAAGVSDSVTAGAIVFTVPALG